MQNHPPREPAPDTLPESAVARLLARASELDAPRAAALDVAALRAAAVEAGISAHSFDAALAELRAAGPGLPDVRERPRWRSRLWALAAVALALVTVSTYGVSRVIVPSGPAVEIGAPMVEEALLLECLSPGEAAELIRPLLRHPSNTVVASPQHAPRVLTIRGTPTQLRDERSLLQRHETPGTAACATGRS